MGDQVLWLPLAARLFFGRAAVRARCLTLPGTLVWFLLFI
jgi:hypothetical protein